MIYRMDGRAELMKVVQEEVETGIAGVAQRSRAASMYMINGRGRATVNVGKGGRKAISKSSKGSHVATS